MSSATPHPLGKPLEFLDDRIGLAKLVKKNIRKVFPDHWSFLLGEIALYSFIILLLSGTFLTLWFKPSMQEVVYSGPYLPLRGVHMSEAFSSTLDISFGVRGGLLMRQIHHWSAMLFIGAMTLHMLRTFFTGAFRKPRELNWLIGTILLQLGLVEGFTGYSLPDDLLSGTGLRFIEGLLRAFPVVGTYLSYFVFGGAFPGDVVIPRLYPVHILLLPGVILALITAHLALVVYHKHTQFPGPGRTNQNVVGYPLLPVYMAKAGGFFFIVFGVTALMGALFQLNPVWVYGPYNPSQVGAGTQPDWYMGWVEGGLRLMPNWETHFAGFTISWNIFIPGFGLLGLMAVVLALYPFIESWVTGDRREHHLLDRPRNQPVRTAFGVAGMTFYGLLWIGGGNDILATTFHLSINSITWFLRFAIFIGPVIAFLVTKRICIGLQRADRDRLLHGRETGIVMRAPNGEVTEIHAPLDPEEAWSIAGHDSQEPLQVGSGVDAHGVADPHYRRRKLRARASRFYFSDQLKVPTKAELEAAHSNGHGHELANGNGHARELAEGNGHAGSNGEGTKQVGAGGGSSRSEH
ncbi:ubiquinol-cytochrome c reductase cytochrome b subunit [Actinopolymorpha cephalotaxi]|uniref:Cytochrome bc1 complex cytochrome b subunit n=1 Tax=Actinopolymorpha cephalotaxi TaxID=504797 RepID=A0A1I2WG32_9ACTN|nr:ubiquinol-cytochrome c reductase cytochrome b subunit [Actinopolymorpha cephalotaxi]NYH82594.1 ubiquinol-cytochrome c reductase cytochrome b subunit [Actinopolymorpha cephalotaxi]SFH00282.1 ubiquinol-cytochrome c reductase cytochrome b subunit [Actinopolymorpha cephalotaxi]